MRRVLPAILIGLGVFLVTLALLFRFYAVPKLAVVPYDQYSEQTVLGPDSTYFDVESLSVRKGLVTTVATVIGDAAASREASSKTGRDLAVWDKGQVSDNNDEKPPMEASEGRIVFDRFTGEAVNCCGETLNGEPIQYSGQLVKWPFFTEKKTYQYWDNNTKKAFPATYAGEETIDGLAVYRFEQDVPRQVTDQREAPSRIFGISPDVAVTADRYYQNHRTFWIEPVTGVIIKLTEKQYQTLEVAGGKPVVALDTTSTFSDETVAKNVADYKSKSAQLAFIKGPGPIGFLMIGAVLILAGAALTLMGLRRARRDEQGIEALLDEPQRV